MKNRLLVIVDTNSTRTVTCASNRRQVFDLTVAYFDRRQFYFCDIRVKQRCNGDQQVEEHPHGLGKCVCAAGRCDFTVITPLWIIIRDLFVVRSSLVQCAKTPSSLISDNPHGLPATVVFRPGRLQSGGILQGVSPQVPKHHHRGQCVRLPQAPLSQIRLPPLRRRRSLLRRVCLRLLPPPALRMRTVSRCPDPERVQVPGRVPTGGRGQLLQAIRGRQVRGGGAGQPAEDDR